MDLVIVVFVLLTLLIVALVARSAFLAGKRIEEAAKTERSRANSMERANIKKMDGLFEMKLQEMASRLALEGTEGDGILELLKLFGTLKPAEEKGKTVPEGNVSWDVLKEQLRNPEVKKVIMENKNEALQILQS